MLLLDDDAKRLRVSAEKLLDACRRAHRATNVDPPREPSVSYEPVDMLCGTVALFSGRLTSVVLAGIGDPQKYDAGTGLQNTNVTGWLDIDSLARCVPIRRTRRGRR